MQGNGAKCVVMAVYGNREFEDTLVQMQDAAAQQGFQVIAGVAAVAQHSMLPQYATGRPDKGDESTLEKFSTQILEKLQAGDTTPPNMPGNRPYKKAGGGLVPAASSACKNCGLLWKNAQWVPLTPKILVSPTRASALGACAVWQSAPNMLVR